MADENMARSIPLTKGLVALVSPDDFASLSGLRWSAVRGGRTHYAQRMGRTADGRKAPVLLHRMIMAPPPGFVVDHINGDGLDNRRENLRICTHRQNIRNQQAQAAKKTSRFKGVWRHAGRWAAMIQHNGDKICLGRFDTEEAAARQYDRMARVLFGPFARTNKTLGLLID